MKVIYLGDFPGVLPCQNRLPPYITDSTHYGITRVGEHRNGAEQFNCMGAVYYKKMYWLVCVCKTYNLSGTIQV